MSDQASSGVLYFNGINGSSGAYETPPLSPDDLARAIQGDLDLSVEPERAAEIVAESPDDLSVLRQKKQDATEGHFGVKEGVDPGDLSQSGWGVIFAFKDKDRVPAIRDALAPLLNLRREQAGRLYREYADADGYRPNESKQKFLERFQVGPGPADPEQMPYYLLIVGDPETIPYRFQYQLDVQRAVGRLHFDKLEHYAYYAQSVVAAESGQYPLPRRATFFGVANPKDPATQLSAKELVDPLSASLKSNPRLSGWAVDTILADQARKSRLAQVLGGPETPALLFTASHGMGFDNGDKRQFPHQGALLCQDWPGPEDWRKPIPQDFYLAADDITAEARLLGRIAFFFACYGAGTPRLDDFSRQTKRGEIAPHAFLSQLPMRLLSHEKGGALAVVGHVERAWGVSFHTEKTGKQLAAFESTLERLMKGDRIGWGMEYFNERYAELSSDLTDFLQEVHPFTPDNVKLGSLWTANNDARGYVVLGDPAVRLTLGSGNQPLERAYVIDARYTPGAAPAAASAVSGQAGDVNYGLLPDFGKARDDLQEVIRRISQALVRMIDKVTTVEVRTHLAAAEAGAEPVREAKSIIRLDGDEEHIVPRKDDDIDRALWMIHEGMVAQARQNRAEIIRTIGALFKA